MGAVLSHTVLLVPMKATSNQKAIPCTVPVCEIFGSLFMYNNFNCRRSTADYSSCHLQHVELQRDFDAVKVGFVSCLEVNDVSLGFGRADVDVEGVHDGLPEVLRQSRTSQRRQVYSMEIFLVPKVDLQ